MNQKEISIIICTAVFILIVAGIVIVTIPQSTGIQTQSKQTTNQSSAPISMSSTILAMTTKTAPTFTSPPTTSQVQDRPLISPDQAIAPARNEFPSFSVDRVNMTYLAGTPHNQPPYEFDLFHDNERLVQGGLNPDNGKLTWYAIPIKRIGRQDNPSITIDAARNVAESEIRNHNGALTLNLSESRYDLLGESKVAGVYVFVYTRLAKNIPCESDGFTLTIDSISGKVVEYRKTWVGAPNTNSFC